MSYREEYRRKLISAEDGAGLVKSGTWVDYGWTTGFPTLIDEKLAERAHELEKVKVRACLAMAEPRVLDAGPEHFIYNTYYIGQKERREAGRCFYLPMNSGETPRFYREFLKDKVDIAFMQVTAMDEHGYFNFGSAINCHKAICDAARTVVVEVTESQPWVYGGYDEVVHISQVDHIVENGKYEVPELIVPQETRTDEAIAEYVVELIEDGATIQFGWGRIPNLVGEFLIKYGKEDLGIHSGFLTESMVDLIEAGVVTGAKDGPYRGRAVICDGAGTRKLYQYMDHNMKLAGIPVDYSNSPYIMALNKKLVCINTALRVDLQGQVCSQLGGSHPFGGTGGQVEFIRGGYMSPGGKAFICLHSTRRDGNGELTSNIVPTLLPDDVVTVPRTDISYVVTEYGVVNLKGKSTWERAKLLVSIAHPDFHAGLEEAACKANLITRGTRALDCDD